MTTDYTDLHRLFFKNLSTDYIKRLSTDYIDFHRLKKILSTDYRKRLSPDSDILNF